MEPLSKADQQYNIAFSTIKPRNFFPPDSSAFAKSNLPSIRAVLEDLKIANISSHEQGWQVDGVDGQVVEEKWAGLFGRVLHSASLQNDGWHALNYLFAWRSHEMAMVDGLRQPDVILVQKAYEKIAKVPFGGMLTYMEVKETLRRGGFESATLQVQQCAGFATACQINRLYYIGSILENKNRRLFLILYARDIVYYSDPIIMDKDPLLFIQVLISLSSGYHSALGFDRAFFPTCDGQWEIQLDNTFLTISRRHFLRNVSVIGKGTKVVLCVDAQGHCLVLKDAWLIAGGPNDVDAYKILKERAPDDFASKRLKELFGEDVLNVFYGCLPPRGTEEDLQGHLLGIPVIVHAKLTGNTTNGLRERLIEERVLERKKEALDHSPPFNHLRVLSRTCGVPIHWFSCRRELLNSIMCAVTSHFNGLRKGLLHSDVSEANLWLCVDDPQSVDDVIRDPSRSPMHQAVLGDWGMAKDLRLPTPNNTAGYITGSFPFTSAELLSPIGIKGRIRHDSVHDLESFLWILWVISVNTIGPFKQVRKWINRPDEFGELTREPEDAPGQGLGVPMWATPGIHSATTTNVFQFKKSIPEVQFFSSMTTYWRNGESGKAFKKGMNQLRNHFVWTEDPNGEYRPPRSITHQEFIEILGSMRDGIPVEEDQPTEIDMQNGRERYTEILRDVDNDLGTTILGPSTPSPSPGRPPHTSTSKFSSTLARISGSTSKRKRKKKAEVECRVDDIDSDGGGGRHNAAASDSSKPSRRKKQCK